MKAKLLFALFAALVTTVAWGQDTARLSGSVTDTTGSAIPGATVSLRLPGGEGVLGTTTTTAEGLFSFIGLRPVTVDVVAESTGFQKQLIRNLKLDAGKETNLPAIKMEIGSVTETVEVTGTIQNVQTANAEVSNTVSIEQVRRLPILNRSVLGIIHTQAGVGSVGRTTTVINGLRTPFATSTYDGISVQDNFIRSNSLDFQPNRLFQDQVAEVTVVTSNGAASLAGGAAHVAFVSPSGSNEYHGSLYWYNRNSKLAANTWFNNQNGLPQAFLNQNQGGGTLGGPIKKDKLLFYFNTESFRLHQQSSINRTILTDTARNGIFTYRDTGGAVRSANVLQLMNASVDPFVQGVLAKVPTGDKINNFRLGDSLESLRRNTGGYSFLARSNTIRDNMLAKIDFLVSTKNTIAGSYSWNRERVDRNDAGNDYSTVPKVYTNTNRNLLSANWRSTPNARLTNELRGGFFFSPTNFFTDETFDGRIITGFSFSNPLNTFQPEGRNTDTYSLHDNASYTTGRHQFNFGYQYQGIRVRSYAAAGTIPTYTIGVGTGNPGLTMAMLPGISANDLAAANTLFTSLAGYVQSYTQTFQVKDRTSGFVSGQQNIRNYLLGNHGIYLQDNWKLRPRLMLNLGVRWDYWTPVDERDSLALLPVLANGQSAEAALLNPNGTLDFAGGSSGRRWYNADRNNFAPNIGLAWDIFGDGKTSLRLGYSISYVNDEMIVSLDNSVSTNRGLNAVSAVQGLPMARASNPPAVVVPAYKVPRTYAENNALDAATALAMPDPNLVTPYVQAWNIGIQREIKGFVVEARYVGNHGVKLWRAFDFNQIDIKSNGFLADFNRAVRNAELSQASGRGFVPSYNAAIAGSQPLPIFDRLTQGGALNNAAVLNLIRQNAPGELANTYAISRFQGVDFYRNRNSLGTNLMTNYSNSTYNAFQFDVRRQVKSGLFFQGNYVYSKVLSDSLGDTNTRFEPFLDINNAGIERARAPFDLTHQLKFNYVYDLPFGRGRRFNTSNVLDKIVGGWSLSGWYTWQSGTPYSVISGRGTLNRGGRSTGNTANTNLNKAQLDELLQFRMTGNGPYMIAASALGPDGRAVQPDGAAPFNGQVFFQPGAGEIGSLQRRMFSGPSGWSMDMAVQKKISFTERINLELRMETFNTFNHPTFDFGSTTPDQTITSTSFGRLGNNLFGRRLIQLGAYLRF